MIKIEQIKKAIKSLPDNDFIQLRKWFLDKDWENWDKQIEVDSQAGKLDFFMKEVLEEKKEKKLRNL